MRSPRSNDARLAAGLAISALLGLTATRAVAMEPVRLAWARGEGAGVCAAEKAIAERVTARLGEGAISAGAARSIEAVVQGTEKGFRAVLYVRDATGALTGSRELTSESESCASIEAASVLAIALAIDPDAALRTVTEPAPGSASPPVSPAPSTGSPDSRPASTGVANTGSPNTGSLNTGSPGQGGVGPGAAGPAGATPPLGATAPSGKSPSLYPTGLVFPPIPRASAPVAAAEEAPRAGLSFHGGPGFGLLPALTAGLMLGGFLAVGGSFELTAEALWMPEVRTHDRHFAFGLTGLSLGACRSLARGRGFDFGACAAVWGGALHAVVYDLAPEAPGEYGWAAASLTPRLRFQVAPHVHLDLGVLVLVPFVRRRFQVEGTASPVFQQAPVTMLPFVGGGVHFL